MDHLIYDINNFFALLLDSLVKSNLTAIISISATALFFGAGAIYLLIRYLDWVADSPNGVKTLVFFFKAHAKLFVLWFLVAGSPAIFGTMSVWSSARVIEAANGPLTDATQKLFTQMFDTTFALTELVGAYANALFDANPLTSGGRGWMAQDIEGYSDGQNQVAADNAIAAQAAATRDLEAQLKKAQEMVTSTNPDRARIGREMVTSIQDKLTQNKATLDSLKERKPKAPPPPPDDGWLAKLFVPLTSLTRTFTILSATLYGGIWLGVYNIISFIILLPGILLGLWGAWKLIGHSVELFSFLFNFAAKVIVGAMVSVGLAPLSMLSLLFPSTQEYGKHLISWWLQVILATITLGAVVQMAAFAIGGITDSIGGLTVELTRILLGGLSGTASEGTALFQSIAAGTALLSVGYAFGFITTFCKGTISSAAGLVSGHFHA